MMTLQLPDNGLNYGKIVSKRGDIIEICFENDLPPVNAMLRSGKGRRIAIKVLKQLDEKRIRGVSLSPAKELVRGMLVQTEGRAPAEHGAEEIWKAYLAFGNTMTPTLLYLSS